jgi:hypothetical protein
MPHLFENGGVHVCTPPFCQRGEETRYENIKCVQAPL